MEKTVLPYSWQKSPTKKRKICDLSTGQDYCKAYYPERLAKLYLLHMPWFFVSVWRLVSRFMEKATLEKIVFLQPKWNNEFQEMFRINYVGTSPCINCIPSSLHHHRLGSRDRFLILSSDELYQYFPNEETVSEVELSSPGYRIEILGKINAYIALFSNLHGNRIQILSDL